MKNSLNENTLDSGTELRGNIGAFSLVMRDYEIKSVN